MRRKMISTTMLIHEEDLFDRLPDAILLTIFDKLQDAKSLSISSSLCKRFRLLTTQTQHVSLAIPSQKYHKPLPFSSRNKFVRFFLKPFQFVYRQISQWNQICMPCDNTQKKSDSYSYCTCSSYASSSPAEILRNFTEIKELEIRVPSNGGGGDSDSLLKWKGEFGSQLKNCLVVGGISLSPIRNDRIDNSDAPIRELELQRMTNEDLKLRIVWIISSLIAASARHCLLEEVIKEKKLLNKVVIMDDIGQGKVCMNGEEVEEMRRDAEVFSSKMPALKVKMWYSPELELPEGGCVMKGATLVVVKPVEEWSKGDDGGDLVAKGFGFAGDGKEEKVFDEVARELVKLERSYSLEMNSF
ncbi:hypothetical protein KY290_000361 [Solanum tuberosum]|uniref:F-box family protein n=1 Tax=Solanum tuberosum TaxID=4113 RepID=A0ABQ7WL22_SOLTU|nr:hypothetical protein KY289_000385 [Solanum tuberosum]KAH0780763.1 hypothetical protein KY290_000361 [Solanum tuberosum]